MKRNPVFPHWIYFLLSNSSFTSLVIIIHMQKMQTKLKNALKTVKKTSKFYYPEIITFNILVNILLKFLYTYTHILNKWGQTYYLETFFHPTMLSRTPMSRIANHYSFQRSHSSLVDGCTTADLTNLPPTDEHLDGLFI